MKNESPNPPKWADRFFEWYCNPILQEEILGDLYERFQEKVETKGLRWARWWYWLNVFLFINKYTLRREPRPYAGQNHLDMFQNYFKTGFRNITKNGLSTFINALGMSLAIGCCLVVFVFLDWAMNTDDFHQYRDEIYVAERWIDQNGDLQLWGSTPEPFGPAMLADFPQVKNIARMKRDRGIMRNGDRVFMESVAFVDDSFYEVFDFPMLRGEKKNLADPEGIVLSYEAAERHFGHQDPIGKEVSLRFNWDDKEVTEQFIVKGVFEKLPRGASFSFGSLIPIQRRKALGMIENEEDWGRNLHCTFLQIPNPEDVPVLESKMDEYIALGNEADENWKVTAYHFHPLSGIKTHTNDVKSSWFFNTHIAGFYMLGMIAISLLLLACFNYMNIAFASANTRLKEISVRKVIGGTRSQIVWQFLSENLIVCALAGILGVFLAHAFFLPYFSSVGNIDFTLDLDKNPRIWLAIFALIILTALGGAGYPSLSISGLRPASIFQKKMNIGGKGRFRKVLLGIQFFLTFITLFAAISFIMESNKMRSKPWGYNPENIFTIEMERGGEYETLRNEMLKQKGVIGVTGSVHNLGYWQGRTNVEVKGEEHSVEYLDVAENFLETMGLDLVDGRGFSAERELDSENAILVNETFRQRMEWEEAVGQVVSIEGRDHYVVGELKDFHYNTFDTPIEPVMLKVASPDDFLALTVRTEPDAISMVKQNSQKVWQQLYPDLPYDYFYQDAVFDNYFEAFEQVNKLLRGASFLTIIICCTGLFGLAMLLMARRMKEISIRKVLGAGMAGLSWRVNREFFITILIASILAAPVGWFLIESLMSLVTPEGADISPLPFILALLALLMMTLVSISRHIYQLAVSNPTKFLRDE